MANDLQPGRNLFQHLGCRLADLGQAPRVTVVAVADNLRLMHHHFPRQMRRQRLAPCRFASAGFLAVWLARPRVGGDLLSDVLLDILQAQLQLHDLAIEFL
jgi:hypothetical protein